MAGRRSGTWIKQFGGDRIDFTVGGLKGFVLYPESAGKKKPSKPMPWVWYAPTFIGGDFTLPKQLHAWYIKRLLAKGFCVAGVDVGESWGNPAGCAGYVKFHRVCVDSYGLAQKACLLPQSRGGLMHYNFAVENPQSVQCIGGIYTLVSIAGSRENDARIQSAFGMTAEQLHREAGTHNPIGRLAPLAKAKVPLFNVHGDNDKIVPLDQNVGELTKRYRALGGSAELLVIPGEGHEEIPVFFTCQALLDFFFRNGREDIRHRDTEAQRQPRG